METAFARSPATLRTGALNHPWRVTPRGCEVHWNLRFGDQCAAVVAVRALCQDCALVGDCRAAPAGGVNEGPYERTASAEEAES